MASKIFNLPIQIDGDGLCCGRGTDEEKKNQTILKPTVKSFEDALENLGGFSWFQIWVTFVILLPGICAGMMDMLPIFVSTSNVQFSHYAVNLTDEQNGGVKKLGALDHRLCELEVNGTPIRIIPSVATGEPIASIVQQWELICANAWMTELFTSIQMFGMLTGAFCASQLADTFGRKKVFFIVIGMIGLFGVGSGLAPNIPIYGLTKYFTGIGIGGYFVVYVIFLMEFLTPKWRTLAGCLSVLSVGLILLPLLSYFLPQWRHLTWAVASPALFLLIFYPVIPESPRWLLCKERTSEAHQAFLQIAKMNGSTPMTILETNELQQLILAENPERLSCGKRKEGLTSSVIQILTNPTLLGQLIIFGFGCFSCALVYYSMSFNTKNLSGNPHLNVLYLGLIDGVAFPSGIFFNNWLGRRRTYSGFWLLATLFLISLVFVDQLTPSSGVEGIESEKIQNTNLWVTVLSFLGRIGVSGAWGVVTCFAAESFPTTCRSTAMGLCATSANIGGVLAPQIVFLGKFSPSTPYIIFAGFSLVCALTSGLLKETKEQPLRDFLK